MPLSRLRVGERVEEARAVHRLLANPVDRLRFGDADRLQDGRADVDAMRELAAQAPAALDPVRPGDHHRVPVAPEVTGHLLTPLTMGLVPFRAAADYHLSAGPVLVTDLGDRQRPGSLGYLI